MNKQFKAICIPALVFGLSGFAYPAYASGIGSKYHLLLIFGIVLLVYMLSYVLSLTRVITAIVHRKIWNVVLLVSTLTMLVLGLLLTIWQDYRLYIHLPFDMTFWHVEAGIVMGVVAIFHICWHWRYFAGLFKKANQADKQ